MAICSIHKGSVAKIFFCFSKVSACRTSQNSKDFDQVSMSQT